MCDDIFSNQTDIMKNHTYTHTHTDIFINIILLCCTKLSVSVDVTEQKNDKWVGLDGVSKCVMRNERMK
jgi:hypothetical protein